MLLRCDEAIETTAEVHVELNGSFPVKMIATKVTTWESRGLSETNTVCRGFAVETRSLFSSRKTPGLAPPRAKSPDVTPPVYLEAIESDPLTEPLRQSLPERGSSKKRCGVPVAVEQLPLSLFSEATWEELFLMYRSAVVEGDLSSALYCVRQFVRADRSDVLHRIIQKKFLKAASRQKAVEIAIEFVELLPKQYVDRRTYNMLAMVCVQARDPENALRSAELMQKRGFKMDLPMYTNLISAYGMSGDVNKAFQLYAEMKDHGLQPDCTVAGALATVCASKLKTSRSSDRRGSLVLLERASSLLQDLQNFNTPPDTILCNVLVTCAGRAGQLTRSVDILEYMKEHSLKADYITYGSLIDSCVKSERRDMAKKVYELALKELPQPHISLLTVALESCMCGPEPTDSDRAFEIYRQAERSGQPMDVHFFSTMIRVAGKAGMADLALSIEDNMRVQGIEQSTVTCSALISAALSARDLKLASKIYTSMTSKGIFPSVHQFTNLIQAYHGAHRFGDIVRLVEDMVICEMKLDDVTADTLLGCLRDDSTADLAFAVYTQLKGMGVPTTERICHCLLDICHIQIKALRGMKWEKPGVHGVSITEGKALLRALAGDKDVPQVQSVSVAVWVDRAISLYKSALASGVVPSLRLLEKVLACLRIPGRPQVHEPSHPDVYNYASLSYGVAAAERSGKRNAEECFDRRVLQLIKEAIQTDLIPPFCIDDQRETRVGHLPPSVAEAYVFTMLETIKFRYRKREHYVYTLIFKVSPFNPRRALLPRAVWRGDGDESVLVGDEGEDERTALAVIAILRRRRLWHHTEPRQGIIYITPRDLSNWMHAEEIQKEASSVEDEKYKSPFSAKLASQRHSIRAMNNPELLDDSIQP